MKKKALLSALLMLMSFGIARANVVTIGDGTDNDLAMLPLRAGNNFSFSQQIFTSAEIGTSGEITHIAFRKYSERAVTRNIAIYMVQTNKTAFTSNTDWVPVKETDKVFLGEVTFGEGTDWTNIQLDRAYEYWDAQNLAVIVDDNTGEGAGGAILFYTTSCSDSKAIIAVDDNDIVPASYSSYGGTPQSSRSQVMISITPLNQDVVKVGGGLHSTTSLPSYFGHNWNVSQQIYTAAEMGGAGTIKSIAYKTGLNDFSSKFRKGDLYMMHTTKSTFANANDWLNVANATKVFSGSWGPYWPNHQVDITLTTPFDYDGISNLALIWVDENNSTQGSPQPDFLTFDAPSQAISSYTSISAFDPSNLYPGSTTYSGNVLNEKNQMWFSITPLSTIGGGSTDTNAELPIRTAYNFSFSEQIYTPAEIGRTGFITGFSFYCASANYASFKRWLDVYVKTTDQNAFSTQNDWIPVEDKDMYFSGDVTIQKNGWAKVTFDKPFRYNGKGNLLIGIDDNSATSVSDAYFRAFFDPDLQYRSLYAASASDIYPQADMSPVTGTRRDFKTSLMLSFQDQWAVGSGDAEFAPMPVYTLYNYSISQQVYTPAELVKDKCDITSLSFFNTGEERTRNIDIYLSSTDYFEKYANRNSWKPVTASNMVFSGEVTFVSGDWTDIPLNKVYNYISYGGGSHSLVVTVVDKTGDWKSGTRFLAYPAEAQALYAYSDYRTYDPENMSDVEGYLAEYKNQIQFNNVAANIKPTAFRVTDLTFTSATVEWMGEAATSWNLEYKAEDETDWTHYGLPKTVNSFVLSGLKPLTNYTVRVQSVDGSNTSDWTELKLSTDLTPKSLQVVETTYNSATLTWGGPGKKWQLRYQVSGETDWTEVEDVITEQPYILTGLEEETDYFAELRVVDDNGNAGTWVNVFFGTPEQYPRPTDFALVEATPYSAIFTLTENCGATEWEFCLMDKNDVEIKSVRATSIPYVFVGLEQDTEYNIKVRSVIDSEGEVFSNWSVTVYFTTLPVNGGINGVAVDAKTNSATVTWEGESEKYKVNCRKYSHEAVFFEDFETADFATNGWTIIANGATVTGEDGWYYSSNTYSGLYSAEACSWYYNGIDGIALDADNWLISPVLDLQGTLEFWQNEYAGNLDNYEVLLSTTGKDIADFTTVLREMAPGLEGWNLMTFDLSAYEGQQGYVAIHHKDNDKLKLSIDDFGIFKANPYPWETVETTEKTATLEGLEADTPYEFYIVGSTHGQEDIYTSNMIFTTLVNNPVPYNIDVTTTPNSASFEWEGNSDMYVLQYREVMHDPTFFEGFEAADLATTGWTVYTNGESPYPEGWRSAESERANNGSKVATSISWASDTEYDADNWLVSPKVDLGGTLKFYQCVRADYPDEYEVLLSTSGNTPSDFTTTLRPMGPAFHGAGTEYRWVPVTFDLSAYESMSGYIAIHHKDKGKNRLLIDDFGIYASASNYSTWQTAWTQEKSKTIEGLKEGTEYEIFITGSKTGEPDAKTDIFSFTTKPYAPVELTFYDDAENNYAIANNNGVYANVTIQGRTLKKDGKWQTICLPFDVDVENSVLAGADVRTLDEATYFEEAETLVMDYLTPVTKMEAGVPYIIRWEEGADIVNPVFNAVTVIDGIPTSIYAYYGYARYCGLYNYFTWTSGPSSYWVLADDNPKLTNVDDGYVFHAFDGFFEIDYSIEAKAVVLNTGDGDELVTGISSVGNAGENEVIYNLAGQRLAKKQRGINIVNGKKILVK